MLQKLYCMLQKLYCMLQKLYCMLSNLKYLANVLDWQRPVGKCEAHNWGAGKNGN